MENVSEIFCSKLPEEFGDGRFDTKRFDTKRFDNHIELQEGLIDICKNWLDYLKLFQVHRDRLFDKKMPWEQNERALVSTLAASIVRKNPQTLILEEMPVIKPRKPAGSMASSKEKKSDHGRCDLWVANARLGDDSPFPFLLEAKKSNPKNVDEVKDYIRGDKGIGKIFRDYAKSLDGNKITQRGPYPDHYNISMLTVPFASLNEPEQELSTIREALHDVFNDHCSAKFTTKDGKTKGRRLYRYPTVGLIVRSTGDHIGMVTTFTVLAEGKKTNFSIPEA